jgi:predicted lipid-binding transport protein (Tim44 family)
MRKLLLGIVALLVGSALVMEDAEARRIGGARSMGTQRSVAKTPPAATPAKPAQQQAAGQPAAGQQAAGAPASGLSKWGPLLGGLAIGGLLGAMFGGSGLGVLLLVALLAIAAVVAFRMLARRRAQEAPRAMQFAGMNERVAVAPQPSGSAGPAAPARPTGLPAGFDAAAFLRGAKLNFVKLQVANDAGNLEEIREFTTPQMFEELAKDVAERGGAQHTDVASLEADLLEVVTEGERHWASVRFSGLVREAPGAEAVEFQEVWNLAKPVDGSSGWLLAGIQQMQ